MSDRGAAPPTPPHDPAIRRALVVRLVVVHTLAYAVAFPWAVAAVPAVFVWKERELLALADERDAIALVLRWAIVPAIAVFLVPHALGIPWIRSARDGTRRGLLLFAAGSVALTVAGVAAAITTWLLVVGR